MQEKIMRPAETGAHEKTYMMLEYAMIRLERKMDLFYPFPTMQEWNETCRKMLVDALKDALTHEKSNTYDE